MVHPSIDNLNKKTKLRIGCIDTSQVDLFFLTRTEYSQIGIIAISIRKNLSEVLPVWEDRV